MADANMAWAELPEECLVGILRHLPCLLDHAMFSGVCTRWRTIAGRNLPARRPPEKPPRQADKAPHVTNISLIHAVILSAAPSHMAHTHIHPCYAAAIVSGNPNIAFWRPGMSYWTPPMLKRDAPMKKWKKMLPKDPIEDVIFCVGPLGEGFSPTRRTSWWEVLARYLVQTRLPGELLMVVRFVSTEKATVAFDVFRLELEETHI
ncbi:hypothetical protein E2562_017971 [Oryza meyeriana var. granulata]|uniref:F-box domain-containing protein n=1 Tax=Oryza meyeriana var. granulata TaxID=110450 RepID=A0A6G1F935_9ORYZ|nr:hypothetical protein E2562_017971 [Oryza meyeriana var. granulata]